MWEGYKLIIVIFHYIFVCVLAKIGDSCSLTEHRQLHVPFKFSHKSSIRPLFSGSSITLDCISIADH